MKTQLYRTVLCFFILHSSFCLRSWGQGTAFTYQGQLQNNGGPASGAYNLQFTLYTNSNGGTAVAGPVTTNSISVTNGLFTVTIDFGANAWNGATNWLQIGVETNGAASFTTLSPRQRVTPVPYAIDAESAQSAAVADSVAANNITGILTLAQLPSGLVTNNQATVTLAGAFSGNGSGLASLNASDLASGVVPLLVLPGFQSSSNYSMVGGGQNNVIALISDHSVIGGGWYNTIGANDYEGTIAGGYYNALLPNAAYATIGGGEYNTNSSYVGTISGGQNNFASGQYQSAVGGGYGNQATGSYATVPGGANNIASGLLSFAAGNFAQAANQGAFVWADSQNSAFSSTINDSFNVRAQGGARFVTSGAGMTIDGQAVITGMATNFWQLDGNDVSNNQFLGSTNDLPLRFRVNNMRALIILTNPADSANLIAGSPANSITAGTEGATIAGGGTTNFDGVASSNSISSSFSSVGGGSGNSIQSESDHSFIGGGLDNSVGFAGVFDAQGAFIGGGGTDGTTNVGNTVEAPASSIVGGVGNSITGMAGGSFIGGGYYNEVPLLAYAATVGGGQNNIAAGAYATVPGGYNNYAGDGSFAAGTGAQAGNNSFVWSDGSTPTFSCPDHGFAVQASGGVTIDAPVTTVSGVVEAQAFVMTSDRNAKENFKPVSATVVLDRVVALPISQWNFKQDKSSEHIGPMAQDFYAAFNVGPDDKHITTIDEGGVALAAIQGLNQKLEQKETEITELKNEVSELKQMIKQLAQGQQN